MKEKSLSILIPTLQERWLKYSVLYNHLQAQVGERDVRIIPDSRGRHITIGTKRQEMLQATATDYVVFVDDDDMVEHNYVELIYDAIQKDPDVVGLRGWMTTNGANPESWSISIKYPEWKTDFDGFRYVRCPNHLAPIKREHALAIGYDVNSRFGEDADYSMRLRDAALCKKEEFIDQQIYHYIWKSNK